MGAPQSITKILYISALIIYYGISPPLVDHTHYFRHAPARLRIAANMFALACGYAAVCLLVPLRPTEGATQAGSGVRLTLTRYKDATSTHETNSSSIEPQLSLSGVNY